MESTLYIHIPFCRRKCIYCDFYSIVYEKSIAGPYLDTILSQIRDTNSQFSTIYIGGGTPTVLDKNSLARLLKAAGTHAQNDVEFTIEANPESLDAEKINLFLDSGVNRLSIGLQSLNDHKLHRLGRIHDARQGRNAVYLAHKRGFKNISIDLIFGIWEEKIDAWKRELREAAGFPITHVSCYSLSYERETPLFSALKNRSITPLEDHMVAEMYEAAVDALALGGFKQYEVSNFAKEGFVCRHNLNYWENGPYIGLGASAVSYLDGVRAKNVSSVGEYIKRVDSGRSPVESSERLSALKRAKESAAIKIRTKEGIDFARFKEKTGFDFLELEACALKELVEKDLVKYKKENNVVTGVCLKRKGFLFCDTVSSAFL